MAPPLVLAHRGARRDAPENTLEAFTLALAQGADGVELDVHCTADGGLVVHHDAAADGLGVLATRSTNDIRAARPDIPTLDEALDACAGALVNVEIKNLPGDADYDAADGTAGLVVAALERRAWHDDVVVSSFNLGSIDRVRSLSPSVPTGLLAMVGFDAGDALDVCVAHGHAALHPALGMLAGAAAERLTTRAHEHGVRVRVWTVNDDDDIRRLAAAGIDAIITDVPESARRALRAG